MRKHTPGPWLAEGPWEENDYGWYVEPSDLPPEDPEPVARVSKRADALLIAAAPDLLEALKGLAAAIYAVRDDLRDDYPAVSEKFVLGLAAIAKAEGR